MIKVYINDVLKTALPSIVLGCIQAKVTVKESSLNLALEKIDLNFPGINSSISYSFRRVQLNLSVNFIDLLGKLGGPLLSIFTTIIK